MTATDLQTRNEKAAELRVFQVEEGVFYVESSRKDKCYRVLMNGKLSCSCTDFTRHIKNDPDYKCKHILAALNAEADSIHHADFNGSKKPKLEKRYITSLHGKDFVLYAGILDLAHQRGLQKLEVELIQYPTKENGYEAICKAVAVSKSGEVYTDIGDANSKNTNKSIALHLIRMASTRAKARVLRDLNNIGMTALEELADCDEVIGGNGSKSNTRARKTTSRKATAASKEEKSASTPATSQSEPATQSAPAADEKPAAEPQASSQNSSSNSTQEAAARPKMSEAQRRAVYNLAKRRGISEEDLEAMAAENYGTLVENLSSTDAASFIRSLQTAA